MSNTHALGPSIKGGSRKVIRGELKSCAEGPHPLLLYIRMHTLAQTIIYVGVVISCARVR